MNQAQERRAKAALEAWGCRRPDKVHRIDEESALRELGSANKRIPAQKGVMREVYRCCEAGWVWGNSLGSRRQRRVIASQA